MASQDSPRQLIVFAIVITTAAALLVWSAYLVREALLLVYVSGLFAIGFSPLVRFIERQKLLPIGPRRFPRWLAILLVYLTILGAIAGVGALVVPAIVKQSQELWKQFPAMFDRLQALLQRWGLVDHPITVQEIFEQAPNATGDMVGPVMSAILGFAGGVFGLLTILILSFYILIEAPALFDRFLCLFPKKERPRLAFLSREITIRVSAWLTGQLVLASIIGTSAAIGLWLLGVPYFYVLALVAAVGEMIPVVGPVIASIPAVAVALTVSPQLALFVVIFFVVQQQIENHVLVPKVMEQQVGISAVTVIIALLIGGSLLGIVGAILAIPTAAIVMVLFDELIGSENASR